MLLIKNGKNDYVGFGVSQDDNSFYLDIFSKSTENKVPKYLTALNFDKVTGEFLNASEIDFDLPLTVKGKPLGDLIDAWLVKAKAHISKDILLGDVAKVTKLALSSLNGETRIEIPIEGTDRFSTIPIKAQSRLGQDVLATALSESEFLNPKQLSESKIIEADKLAKTKTTRKAKTVDNTPTLLEIVENNQPVA